MSAIKTRLIPSLVTVRHIVPTEPQPTNMAAVDAIAQSILSLGACVRPLILRPAGFDSSELAMKYEVVGDHTAYWASCLARNASPVDHEAVTAWVVEGDAADALAQMA